MEAIKFRLAVSEDWKEVIDFVHSNFMPDEPINKSIDLCAEGYRIPYFEAWCMARIDRPGSIVMIAEDSDKRTLGVGIAALMKGEEEIDEPSANSPLRTDRIPVKFQKILEFLGWFEHTAIAQDKDGQVPIKEDRMDYAILTGRSDMRVPGLGTRIIQEMMTVARNRGIKNSTVICTSHFSCRIFKKLGRYLPFPLC